MNYKEELILRTKLAAYAVAKKELEDIWKDIEDSINLTIDEIQHRNSVTLRDIFNEDVTYMGFINATSKNPNHYIKITVERINTFDDIPKGAKYKSFAI